MMRSRIAATRGVWRPVAVAAMLAASVGVYTAAPVCLVSVGDQVLTRREPLHVAFTSSMFAGVNVNDAKAANRPKHRGILFNEGGRRRDSRTPGRDCAAV